MERNYVLGDHAFQNICDGLAAGKHWIAVNTLPLFLEPESVESFTNKFDAISYAAIYKSDQEDYKVFYAASIADVFRHLPYDTSLRQDQANINSQQKLHDMDQKAMNFNENQLKRSGFAEAFTPALEQQMKDGAPFIEHPFQKEYDGDKVDATLHLKKSATSDFYFLNKFDLRLQKEGRDDSTRQTFYVNYKKDTAHSEEDSSEKVKHENRYTLKEAYNLLAGRPVFKHLLNREGQEYDAWVKINFDNKLENGNHEMKQYTQKYGFDLEKVIANYPIKELGNERYKESLLDSLHRGNLQKATFVGADGKEEKLYVFPNITLSALNVYDMDKNRLATETLVQKQFIGSEFSKELLGRLKQNQKLPDAPAQSQAQKENGQTQQQAPSQESEKPLQKQQQKEDKVSRQTPGKVRDDKPSQKKSQKQKIG